MDDADLARAVHDVAVGEQQPSGVKKKPEPLPRRSRRRVARVDVDVHDGGRHGLGGGGHGARVRVEQLGGFIDEAREVGGEVDVVRTLRFCAIRPDCDERSQPQGR